MRIKEINWLDIGGEEAVLKVVSDTDCLVCFSCPCSCDVGDVLGEPLECLDTEVKNTYNKAKTWVKNTYNKAKNWVSNTYQNAKKALTNVVSSSGSSEKNKSGKSSSGGRYSSGGSNAGNRKYSSSSRGSGKSNFYRPSTYERAKSFGQSSITGLVQK